MSNSVFVHKRVTNLYATKAKAIAEGKLWNKCINHPDRDTRARTGKECGLCIRKRSDEVVARENGKFASMGKTPPVESGPPRKQSAHKTNRKWGEQPKAKEALCLTCYGLPHAVIGLRCKGRMTDGAICGQSSEPEAVEVKAQGLKSNFVVDVYE